MENDMLKTALSEMLSERAMQEIPLKKHRFSLKYRLNRRKNSKAEYESPCSYVPLRRMPRAAFIIILLSLLFLAACTAVQLIRGFAQREYKGYSVLSPMAEGEKNSVTEFYWLPKSTGCKYLGRELTYSGENIAEVFSRYEYEGKLLTLWQTLPVGEIYLDTENGSLVPIEYNGLYGWNYDNNYTSRTCWQQDGYMFAIDVSDEKAAEKLIKDMEIYYE